MPIVQPVCEASEEKYTRFGYVLPPYLTLPVKTKSPTTAICFAAGLPAISANNELVPLSYTCNILLCPDAPIT